MSYESLLSKGKRSSQAFIRNVSSDAVAARAAQPIVWFLIQMRRGSKLMSYGGLFISYFVVVTPVAVFLRICGRDALRLKHPSATSTTWFTSDLRTGQCDRELF